MARLPVKNISAEVGSVITWTTVSAPLGYLLCDGQSYTTTTYPLLFAIIGYTHGGAGAFFNVPDYRGLFLRCIDGTAGRDPDASSRAAMNVGGNTGNSVGSVQGHQFNNHQHDFSHTHGASSVSGSIGSDGAHIHGPGSVGPGQYGLIRRSAGDNVTSTGFDTGGSGNEPDILNTPQAISSSNSSHAHGFSLTAAGQSISASTGNVGGNETRPTNAYVNYAIKY